MQRPFEGQVAFFSSSTEGRSCGNWAKGQQGAAQRALITCHMHKPSQGFGSCWEEEMTAQYYLKVNYNPSLSEFTLFPECFPAVTGRDVCLVTLSPTPIRSDLHPGPFQKPFLIISRLGFKPFQRGRKYARSLKPEGPRKSPSLVCTPQDSDSELVTLH